jgi:hypothetical protein
MLLEMLLTLAVGGHGAGSRSAAALRSTRWAERVLASQIPFDRRALLAVTGDETSGEDAFAAVIHKYGASPRSLLGLGRARLAEDDLGGAIGALREAARRAPGDRRIRTLLRSAMDQRSVARRIARSWGKGYSVVKLRMLPNVGPPRWAAVLAHISHFGDLMKPEVATFELKRATVRRLWRARVDDGEHEEVLRGVDLWLADLTGDGKVELAVSGYGSGAGFAPCQLSAYSLAGATPRLIGTVLANNGIWLAAPGSSGRVGVVSTHEIGEICHAGQPRWTDVYVWRRGHFRVANEEFAPRFRPWIDHLRGVLWETPDDEVRAYLALTYELQGERQAARRQLRHLKTAFLDAGEVDDASGPPGCTDVSQHYLRQRLVRLTAGPSGSRR